MPEAHLNTPAPEDYYQTIASTATAELKVKRSRFIGLVRPISSAEEARIWIKAQEKAYHDARHVCYAWRLGHHQNVQEIRCDAGEPAGTAGEPLLVSLRRVDVSNAVVVVIRYFGGIKLGTGGLARAYGETAETAVTKAGLRTVLLGRQFSLTFPYPLRKTVAHLLTQCQGKIKTETYSAEIQWQIWLPMSRCQDFEKALKESTAGTIIPQEVEAN